MKQLHLRCALALLACLCVPWAHGAEPARHNAGSAAQLLFRDSDLTNARTRAATVLRSHPADLDALFVEMEAAALAADTAAELDTAVRLCESRIADPRVIIAAARILDLAANSAAFRAVAPRVRALAGEKTLQVRYFRAALLEAASDGLPGDSVLDLARRAGFLTDWRIAGPSGRFPSVDFDRLPQTWEGAHSEAFQFADGNIALPDYFRRNGVYFGESQILAAAPGDFFVRVEGAGTLAIAIDGTRMLTKDARFYASPGIAVTRVHLGPGRHRVFVKFLGSALPFRLAVFPAERVATRHSAQTMIPAEAAYVSAAQQYWSGDYAGAITRLKALPRRSAPQEFLLALAWAHAADAEAPEVITSLNLTLRTSPRALAAEAMLAARAYSEERVDEAREHLRHVLAARPDYLPAQELQAEIATREKWQSEAAEAMEACLRLHPNCRTLREAARFFSGEAQFQRVAELEDQLQKCSPSSLAYVEALSDAGRHRQAAAAAAVKISNRPLDREARHLLVRELRLGGDVAAARRAATELAALAANSARFRELAEQSAKDSGGVEDDAPATDSALGDSFYAQYRRDAFDILARTRERRFSGGPAVILLQDRVVHFAADGSAAAYVHNITQLLTREGIQRYGEVALPESSELLELRTIKADGSVVEPELLEQKATVSMPALAPGDAIDEEYVAHYSEPALAEHPEAFRFVFGSFEAPILFSRFVVLSPAGNPQPIATSTGAPEATVRNGDALRIWEKDDIPQSLREIAMSSSDNLPSVRVLPLGMSDWQAVRDYYREAAIEATWVGSRAEQVANGVSGATPEARALALYRLVMTRIRTSGTGFGASVTPAEETLASGQGSRTAALLALARAEGLQTDLVLAREIGAVPPEQPSLDAYTQPLIRFTLADKTIFADAESDGMPFGGLRPTLDQTRALLVPLQSTAREPLFISLTTAIRRASEERSVAESDITLDERGDLSADLNITLGVTRGAQMRSVLRGIAASGRQHFFEQLAMRIFPGAEQVRGEVREEHDPDRPLVLHVICRAPAFLSFTSGVADIDQLAPALNLRKMYVSAAPRRFSLYIDAPLFETAVFRLHLPPNVSLQNRANDFEERNRFGEYAVHFRRLAPRMFEISRSFHIPVQVVAPGQYADFAAFATRIDDAERQRLTLERTEMSASAEAR